MKVASRRPVGNCPKLRLAIEKVIPFKIQFLFLLSYFVNIFLGLLT